jgi:hypothetical protein
MSGFIIRQTTPANLVPKGHEQINPLTTAQALTVPVGATVAYIQVEDADVRWRDDGTDPTGAVGMLLKAGFNPSPFIGDLTALRFIDDVSGATLNVAYYACSGN